MRVAAALLLAVIAIAVHAPSLGNGFVYDDDYIVKSPRVLDGAGLDDVGWAFTASPDGNWVPLTWLSHLLAVAAFGLAPAGHHLVQVLLHGANAALLFLLLLRVTGAPGRSLAAALLFAVHPVHVESVAWVAERKDVLSTLFGLLALHAWVGYARRPAPGAYLAALGWFAAGLMSKPMLVTLPVLLLLMDWWPLRRASLPRARLAAEKAPFLLLAAGAGLAAVWTQRRSGVLATLSGYPPGVRVANALVSVFGYLRDLVAPLRLAAFYPHPGDAVSRPGAIAALLVLLAVTAALLAARRRAPHLLFGWLWFLVALLPVSGLVQVGEQARADRYAYFTFVGLYVALAWGLAGAGERLRPLGRALPVATGVAAALLALVTVRQVGFWKDNVTLFERAAAVTEGNWIAAYNLGIALAGQKRNPEALRRLDEAVRLRPDNPRYRYDYGRVLAIEGRYPQAEEQYRASLALVPDDPDVHRDLGALLRAGGRGAEAAAELQQALALAPGDARARRLAEGLAGASENAAAAREEAGRALAADPRDWRAHQRLAGLLEAAGDAAGAERHFREAARLSPEAVEARHDLALLLDRRGAFAEAVELYASVVRARPGLREARTNLGVDLEELGRLDEAEAQYREALRLAPGDADALADLGFLLVRRGRAPEAAALLRAGIAAHPGSAPLHDGLGRALAGSGDKAGAVRELRRALELDPGYAQARADLAALGAAGAP
jgi:Flp pilus assembly protein TadD